MGAHRPGRPQCPLVCRGGDRHAGVARDGGLRRANGGLFSGAAGDAVVGALSGRAPPVRTALLDSHLVLAPCRRGHRSRKGAAGRGPMRSARRAAVRGVRAASGALCGQRAVPLFSASSHGLSGRSRARERCSKVLSYLVELALALTIRSLAFGLAAATSKWKVDFSCHLVHLPAPLNGSPERERGRSKRAVRRRTILLTVARSLALQASKVRARTRRVEQIATPTCGRSRGGARTERRGGARRAEEAAPGGRPVRAGGWASGSPGQPPT